jgi:hypothetical protein
MTEQQGKKLVDEVKQIFQVDISKGLKNYVKKAILDVRPKLVNILGTDDKEEIDNARSFLNDAGEILSNELEQHIIDFLKNY